MKSMLRASLLATVFALGTGLVPTGLTAAVQACPGCKNANETDNLRPRAYMLSILFMLGMPATVFTGFGIAFYRMSKRAALEQEQELQQAGESSENG